MSRSAGARRADSSNADENGGCRHGERCLFLDRAGRFQQWYPRSDLRLQIAVLPLLAILRVRPDERLSGQLPVQGGATAETASPPRRPLGSREAQGYRE